MATDLTGSPDSHLSRDTAALAAVTGREIVAVLVWTVAADLLIFRAGGYCGPALFLVLVPMMLWIGHRGLGKGPAPLVTTALILAVGLRLAWSGSVGALMAGAALTVALAMSAAGCVPYVMEGFVVTGRLLYDGLRRVAHYPLPAGVHSAVHSQGRMLSFCLPILAATMFGTIFILANPDLLEAAWTEFTLLAQRIESWVRQISLWELAFCLGAFLLGAGLMRPLPPMRTIGTSDDQPMTSEMTSPLYAAYRNTLVTLIVLFAIYLGFEIVTFWQRDFPEGFYYAGYAHQGAAWLTLALALTTAVLSVVFGGSIKHDPRKRRLRGLAWLWSAQNVLLAAAVYNRLMIYVGYNGMTRLRIVGFFGITAVVIGFVLVLIKIRQERGFWWLMRSQLFALALTMIVHSIAPVDYLVSRYNVAVVRSGYLHPAVMVAVKPTSDEGLLPLFALVDCPDQIIRDGVLAMLAAREQALESAPAHRWSEYQLATETLRPRLAEQRSRWADFRDLETQRRAIESFRDYAMQWY